MYTITAPGTIHSNSKYTVAASLHQAAEACTMDISINGPSYNKTEQVILEPMSTKEVSFDVPKLAAGDYILKAQGVKGSIFEKSQKLNREDNNPLVLMQTDKAKYKPGDLVQFRVLFLDENTRPAKIDKPINLLIIDGATNRVKQWRNIELTKGVFSGEFQLSDQPVLGEYTLQAEVQDGVKKTKTFEVEKYVLPKFEVNVETDKDIAYEDGVIKATIRAKYTYGKPVKGRATVSIDQSRSFHPEAKHKSAEKTVDVDGKGRVEFDLVEDLGLQKVDYMPTIQLNVAMEEALTGNVINATASVNVHEQRQKVVVVEKPDTFKENENITIKLAVKDVRGAPVIDAKNTVKLILSARQSNLWYNQPETQSNESTATTLQYEAIIDNQGIVTFEFQMPAVARSYYSVRAVYLGIETYLSHLQKYQKKQDSDGLLSIDVETTK